MPKIKNISIWLSFILVLVALYFILSDANRNPIYRVLFVLSAVVLVFQLVFVLLKRLNPSAVPDSAIYEMMNACIKNDQGDEWVLVRFRPKVSLAEARYKVGSDTYSEEDRLMGFMIKFQVLAPAQPQIAIFYAPDKGFLLANRSMVKHIVRKYGCWMLDTWYSLNGAFNKEGFSTQDLD